MSKYSVNDLNQSRVAPESGENDKSHHVSVRNAYENILSRNRRPTDVVFLLAFVLFIVAWIVLLGYCMLHGNIYRILNGFDNCGNICGRNNVFTESSVNDSNCYGMDMTNKKYLRVHSRDIDSVDGDRVQIDRICVENCSNYSGFHAVLNRCLLQQRPLSQQQLDQQESFISKTGLRDFFQEVAEDLYITWIEIMYMCAIAFVFSIITLVMFKYLADVIVWLVLIGVILAFTAASALLWIHYKMAIREATNDTIEKRRIKTFLILAIISTIITVILILMVIFMRKRIKLVIVLFKEAGKAMSDMPMLMLEPILTFIAVTGIIALWLYFGIWIESSGRLVVQNSTNAYFIKDDTMKASRWYNIMALLWLIQFSIGCQHMVIAGAVAAWYFTSNKNKLNSPILSSFQNLIRFHLGTVAVGSLLIALIQMFRLLLGWANSATKSSTNRATQCCVTACQCCLSSCQSCLQYINRNAYIETAIYGDPFFRAGSKAYTKLMSNSLRVFTINTIGDLVLFLGKIFVVAITILSGMELLHAKTSIHHIWVPLMLAGIFAYLISHCFITVYEMMIDTIFLCFCEDCEMNDGINRPYFMSSSLIDFVTNSKKVMGIE